jgi:transcriptional regulator NrdR family protein
VNYFNYFTEIEETFIRRRGKHLLVSPLDWALIEAWQQRGVPLHIVLRGIENVFDSHEKKPNQKRTVKSLFYCKEEIEAQYAEWLESQVGKNTEDENGKNELFSKESVAAHLEKAAEDLAVKAESKNGELREVLERVINRLDELKNNYQTSELLEESLEKLDALIDNAILNEFETGDLTREIEGQMSSYRNKMDPEVFGQTINLMVVKRLREGAEIPRLSLFYL